VSFRFQHEVYDQDGNLLATGVEYREPGASLLGRLRAPAGVELRDLQQRTLLRVIADRGRDPTRFRAIAPDGREIGAVQVADSGEGAIRLNGEIVGRLKEPERPLLGIGRPWRSSFSDTNKVALGHISHKTSPLGRSNWSVVDIYQDATEDFHMVLLAADATVNYLRKPTGGSLLGGPEF
jgi:hypothetical protein